MKFLATALLTATLPLTSAFSMNMNMAGGGRSPLSHQYKTITSVHNSMMNGPMMAPPGEPEPEVSLIDFCCFKISCACVCEVLVCVEQFVYNVYNYYIKKRGDRVCTYIATVINRCVSVILYSRAIQPERVERSTTMEIIFR